MLPWSFPWQLHLAAIPAVPAQCLPTEGEKVWPLCSSCAKRGCARLCALLRFAGFTVRSPCCPAPVWGGQGARPSPTQTHPVLPSPELPAPVPWRATLVCSCQREKQGAGLQGWGSRMNDEWELNLKQKLGEIKQVKAQEPRHGRQKKGRVGGTKKSPQTNKKMNKECWFSYLLFFCWIPEFQHRKTTSTLPQSTLYFYPCMYTSL